MNVSPEEAQLALNDIQHATKIARGVFSIWAYHMLIWGIVWTLGFLASQFQPQWISMIWTIVVLGGIVGSTIVGILQGRRMRMAPGSRAAFMSQRIGISYGVLYCFIILWLIIFPLTTIQISMLWVTVVMFGYIVVGVWFQQPFPIVLGVGVTLMAVIGYYLLPHYFWLWEAVFAGLPLVCLSIYFLISPLRESRKNGSSNASSKRSVPSQT